MTISNYVGLTGRVLSYLNTNDTTLFPVSCTGTKYKDREHLFDLIKYIDIALRGGAGIAVNLDDFIQQPVNSYNFYFYLPETHPDYAQLTNEQLTRVLTLDEVNKRYLTNYDTILVNDSMEENDGHLTSIQDSWFKFIELLNSGLIPIIDLSKLRPSGTSNSKGLTASGAVSFLTIYEAIINHLNKGDLISLMKLCGQMNEVLRRGGIYKNGIVTFNLNYKHRDIVKYLNVPLAEIPGSGKKAIRIDDGILTNKRLMKLIEVRVNDKSLMLMKVVYQITDRLGNITYEKGKTLEYVRKKYENLICDIEELYAQVCVEILFKPNATCLLGHVNLGQIETLDQLTLAYNEVTELLIDLWKRWKNEVGGRGSQYLDASQDRQIGVGVFGLANLLAKFGITYKQHVEALTAYLTGEYYPRGTVEYKLAVALDNAYQSAAVLARKAGLERCITADSWIQTSDGAKQVKNLIGTPFLAKVNGELHSSTEVGFWSNGVKPVYKLTTNRGYSIKATDNHKILTPNNEWVELGDLKVGDKVVLSNQRINPKWDGTGTFELGWLLGQVLGNGCIHSRQNENRKDYARVQFWGDQRSNQLERAISFVETEGLKKKVNTSVKGYTDDANNTCYLRNVSLAEKALELGISPGNKKITPEIEQTSSDFYKGFLQGLFDSDATVSVGREEDGGGKSVSLCQSDVNTLIATQRMLSRLGIESSIYTNSKISTSTIEGRVITGSRPVSNLVITGSNIDQYAALIGFSKQDKLEKLNKLINTRKKNPKRESFVSVVSNIEYVGEEEVYDCTIHDVHEFDANGIRVHNCFTIAPTQSCAYRYTDIAGNTTCRNINPPLARRVRRTSHTVDNLAGWYYHGNVETISDPYLVEKLWENWQELMNRTNLAHCMSYDLYHKVDADWLTYFLTKSPLVTTYYQVYDRIDQSYLNKAVAQIAAVEVEPASCSIADSSLCLSCSE